MRRIGFILSSAVAMAALIPAFAGDMEPGLWQITMDSHAPTEAGWPAPPVSLVQCLTERDAQDPSRLISSLTSPAARDCRYMDKNYSGGIFRFAMVCDGSFGIIAKGSISFGGNSFSGDLTATASTGKGRDTEFQNRISAKRLGSCSK